MASSFNSETHSKIQALVTGLMTDLGIECHFDQSKGFRLKLEVTADGQNVIVTGQHADQGQNNPFAVAAAVAPSHSSGGAIRTNNVVIRASELP